MDSLLIYFYFVRDCPATSYGNGTLDWFYGQNTLRSAIFSIVVFGFCLIKTCGKKNQFLCGHLCFPSVACGAGLACCWGFAPIGEQLFECWFWIFSDWV